MHPQFLPFLADPITHEPLELESTATVGGLTKQGWLRSGRARYPIVDGVPRFAGFGKPELAARSFNYQWAKWATVQFDSCNVGGPMDGHTGRMWESITGVRDLDLKRNVIADFGCGPGRFVETVRRRNGRAIGLDLSAAVDWAAAHFGSDADVLICQADLLHPPLRPGALDGAFSIGVLHHTGAPAAGVEAMASSVKAGGWVALSVYGVDSHYARPMVRGYRWLFKSLWPLFRHYPALAYAYFTASTVRPLARVPGIGLMLRALFPCAWLPDRRWAILDTFDSVTPFYQSVHRPEEVSRWLRAAGLVGISSSPWSSTAFRSRRSPSV